MTKNTRINITLPPALESKLRMAAAKERRTISEIVRISLENYLAKEGKHGPA